MTDSNQSGAELLEELLWVVPRFLDRTGRQLELSRAVVSLVPCIGSRFAATGAKQHSEHTQSAIDVVSVLDGENSDDAQYSSDVSIDSDTSAVVAPLNGHRRGTPTAAPTESELAVPGYDSLAASQVIPRLAMLDHDDLRGILAYEEAHRNRQTIIHKVHQLLAAEKN